MQIDCIRLIVTHDGALMVRADKTTTLEETERGVLVTSLPKPGQKVPPRKRLHPWSNIALVDYQPEPPARRGKKAGSAEDPAAG